ncbi:MAG: glutamyl-tRNA reductase [Cytophagaceae bacterium]|jgi:glutamyl-tRNA reductase|nr:glutamyl-tRNA reductase [Cytophagaceae bacterium]
MIENFKVVSVSFKTASIRQREMLSLQEAGAKQLLHTLKETFDLSELLVVSTCNRTEIYYSSDSDLSRSILQLLCLQKGVAEFEPFVSLALVINDHHQAVEHLFRVSIGLESQVVGDIQIINQVKHAYQWSADLNMAGPFLHRLLHTIFFTNKKVVQETSFRDGAASVSYATVELAEQLTADLAEPKALVIGLGEMGADVCRNLVDSHIKNVTLTNRTPQRANDLAQECGYKTIPFEEAFAAIADANLVIVSISREEPLITKNFVESLGSLSYKFFIDLSVPRSVDPSVEEVPGALVYHIDSIQNKASEALEARMACIPQVERIIVQSMEEFHQWNKEMMVSPIINKLKNALEQIRQEELNRYCKQLSSEEVKKVDVITRNMMQKIIKLPVLQLKAACKRGEADTLIDVLNDLFDLEKQSAEIKE